MGALHRFEQRLEHLVTGAFARVFRSAVQPMEIAAALQREVDNSAQILSRERRLAPNDFTVDLSGTDYDRLATYGQTLSSELAAMLHEHAQDQHYLFAGPITLNFTRSDDLTTGRFQVRSRAAAQVTPSPDHPVSDTAVSRASYVLEVNGMRHPLESPGLVVGRGSRADLRIDDPGISRRHVEFRLQGTPDAPVLSVVDLGSTNGTSVNGHRIQHALLADGAVVQIGSTRLTVQATSSQGAPPQGPAPQGPRQQAPQPYQAQPYQAQPYQSRGAPGRPPRDG